MAITKIQSGAIPADAIDTTHIGDVGADKITGQVVTSQISDGAIHTDKVSDLAVTHAKLHTDMDLSGKTVTLPSLNQALTPTTTNTYELGTFSNQWRDLYLAGSAYVSGDVEADYLTTTNGATFNGNVGIGDDPGSYSSYKTVIRRDDATAWPSPSAGSSSGEAVLALINNSQSSYAYSNLVLRAGTGDCGIAAVYQNAANNSDLVFYTDAGSNGSEQMRLTHEGNVGIGTTNPQAKLNISGSSENIRLDNSGTGNYGLEIWRGGNKGASFAWGEGNANLEIKNYRNDAQADGPYANIDFFTGGTNANSGGSPAYSPELRMRIQQTGEVGIGTTNPRSKLEVNGDGIIFRLDGSPNTSRTMFFRNTSTTNHAQIYADGTLKLWTEDANTSILLAPENNNNYKIEHNANGFAPAEDNQLDLGRYDKGWKNIYTNDLQLSNMNSEEGNEVDGTNGKWTIQEGEEELFIINRLSGKKYAFMLREIE